MRDPYDVLEVPRGASAEDLKKAYRQLAKKLHPDVNPGDKEIEQRFKEVAAAYDLLSDPVKRARFDRGEIDASGNERGWRTGARARRGAGAAAGERGFASEDIFADLFGEFGFGGRRRGAGAGPNVRSRGTDISLSISIPFLDAANGAKRTVDVNGRALNVVIPAGTEDGQSLRLKGQGQPGLGGGTPGDAFIEIHVEPHAFFTRKGADIHVELPVTLQEAVLGGSVEVPTIDGKVALKVPSGSNTGTVLRLKGKGVVDQKSGSRGDQYVKLRVVLPDTVDPDLAAFVEKWGPKHPYDVRRKAGLG